MPARVLGSAVRICFAALACLLLANCSASEVFSSKDKEVRVSQRVPEDADIPKGGGSYKVGRPYNVRGKTYYPAEDTHYRAEGIASWYGPDFHGRLTANGEVYNMNGYSAAHTTLPLPSYARVTNLSNNKSMIVRVNNRGPFVHNRLIDLSVGTAKALGFYGNGIARVRVEYVGRAPMEGSDDRMLLATLREGSPAPAPSKVMIASAKPFLPNLAGASGQSHGAAAPLPAERPFALGAAADRAGSKTASAATRPAKRTAAKPAAKKLPEGSRTEAAVRSLPSSASRSSTVPSPSISFAPAQEAPGGLMSGRGLY